jgi:hypothetical protein
MTKILALAAVALVAVACNGVSPTSPNAAISSDDATALAGATASSVPVPGCRAITEVKLQRLPLPNIYGGDIKVQATYLSRGLPVSCGLAPRWSSRGRGRLSPTENPFIVKVTLSRPPTTFQVMAQAPNGARGSIIFDGGR